MSTRPAQRPIVVVVEAAAAVVLAVAVGEEAVAVVVAVAEVDTKKTALPAVGGGRRVLSFELGLRLPCCARNGRGEGVG